MLFNSLNYLIFFPIVLLLFWFAPKSWRLPLLLIASYVFYMSWLPVYGLLLFGLTLVNYLLGLLIDRFRTQAKLLMLLGLVVNLGTLSFFKYTNFLLKSLVDFLNASQGFVHMQNLVLDIPKVNIILPLGISFFAFEFIHYIVDVYKGDKPIKHPVHFGLFAAFFPSQIAGPIKRFQDFRHQIEDKTYLSGAQFQKGLTLILQGLFKKVALSDNLAPLVAQGFDHVQSIGQADAWICTLAFAWQIYFDFSGYTDMGRGSAMMLGFSLPDNFNFPYLASCASDFWKRWHISLSTWLRDYLYIPLGGGRVNRLRKHLNLMITMLLGGLWHGAAWHFVAWGGFHGAGLVVNHEYDAFAKDKPSLQNWHQSALGKAVTLFFTFLFVLVGWVFFRASSVPEAFAMLSHLFANAPSSAVVTMLCQSTLPFSAAVYLIYALAFSRRPVWAPAPVGQLRKVMDLLPARVAVWAGVFIAALAFAPLHAEPFIYFQF